MQYHIEQYFAVQDTNHNNKQGCLKRVQSADLIWSITTILRKIRNGSYFWQIHSHPLLFSSLLLSSPLSYYPHCSISSFTHRLLLLFHSYFSSISFHSSSPYNYCSFVYLPKIRRSMSCIGRCLDFSHCRSNTGNKQKTHYYVDGEIIS